MSARELLANATPRPWAWFGNTETHNVYLATRAHGRRFVMTFRRWGMNAAQPCFRTAPGDEGLMVPATSLARYEVLGGQTVEEAQKNPYRRDIVGFDSADAALIVAAVNEYEAHEDVTDALLRVLSMGQPQCQFVDEAEAALARLDAIRSTA